jgi:tRNA pseudouridine55 synthase
MNPQRPQKPPYRSDRPSYGSGRYNSDRSNSYGGDRPNRYGGDRGERPPRPKPLNQLNGLLIVNKPVGPTSHDIVYRVRKWSNERRVGHTGTLDPLASGVLIICLGPATRISEYLLASDKKYRAIVRLGQSTDTYDAQGTFTQYNTQVDLTQEQIETALKNFRGKITQTPPAYSAVQVGGKRSYEAAREGEPMDLAPREITIYSLDLVSWKSPDLVIDVACSAGTYIRSLANDIGQALGVGGHIASLMRTATSNFTLKDAHSLNDIETAFRAGKGASLVIETDRALSDWQEVKLDADGAKKIMHGNPAPMSAPAAGLGRAYDPQGRLVALVEADTTTNEWKPKKVLITGDDPRSHAK